MNLNPVQPSAEYASTQLTSRVEDDDPSLDLKKILRWFGIGLAALIIGAFVWEWITSPMIVTVTGTGTKTVPASSATLSFVVAASDGTPAAAIGSTKNKADILRKYLIQRGIAADDIVESQISVVPGTSAATGAAAYQASISMGAKTADVASINDLIASLYGNGATFVSQPTVAAENQDKLSQDAADEAMKDANKQANIIALKRWKLIKKIIDISQASSPSQTTVTSRNEAAAAAGPDQSAALKGVFKITQVVSVSYKMW